MFFLDLPDEILEHIANLLDGFSRAAYALCNHRLQIATRQQGTRLLRLEDVEQVFNRRLPVGYCVRSLDLSHQYVSSPAVERMILECPELRELNVINADLSFHQLIKVMDHLERLDVLSCSLSEVPMYYLQEHRVLRAQRSIRKLFIDCAPSGEVFLFLAKFLDESEVIEYVHLNFVGPLYFLNPHVWYLFPAKAPTWRSLETLVGSFHLANKATYFETLKIFLEFSGIQYGDNRLDCYLKQNMQFVRFSGYHVAAYNANEVIVTTNIDAVRDAHLTFSMDVFNPELAVYFGLPSNLVELDLTTLPYGFPEQSWERLALITTGLKSLACHICFLPRGLHFNSKRFDRKAVESYAIRHLETLRLTKLHLLVGKQNNSDMECKRCDAARRCYILGDLNHLRYLEEFTLVGAVPSPNLWECVANTNLRVLKLCLRTSPSLKGLHGMLASCKNLRYFKLEAPNLPLHAPSMWSALRGSNSLKELCLASNAFGYSDLNAVRACLPILMENMNVFHFHADQLPEIYNVIYEYVMDVNHERPYRNIHLTPRGIVSLSEITEMAWIWTIPGRNLCCVSPFVNKMNLEGWNIV